MTIMEQNNQNNSIMKGKYLIGGFLMAVIGGVIALFVYTRFIDKPSEKVGNGAVSLNGPEVQPILTSLPQPAGQVDFTYAAEQTVHAVVHVRTTTTLSRQNNNPVMQWFYGDNYSQSREVKGYGSGVIISTDGYIITNNHVVENAENVTVKLNDNREFKAEVIGRDEGTDIALLKIKSENLPFIKYGDSDQLKLGEWVLAVGNPFNLTSTVTAGIISAKGRNLDMPGDTYTIDSFIQTDAALNMGNSGGALVNTSGLLVGITSAIVSPNGTYAGNSFAIPVNVVKKVVGDIRQFGTVQRAIIGVTILDVTSDLIDEKDLKLDQVKGVYIESLVSGGSAEDAGLKEKDVIIKLNGVSVGSRSELQEQVSRYRPGDKADVTYIRSGKENTVPVILKNVDNTTKVVEQGEGVGIVLGARFESLSQSEKSDYRIDSGVRIKELNNGRLKELGMQKGYLITSINGKKVKTAAEVKEFTNNGQSLSSIEGYQSNGTYFSYTFRR